MSAISLFEEKQVRRAWNAAEEKWVFAIVDVIAILTESPNPQVYWRVLKKRLLDEGNETVTNCNGLKMTAADGKQRLTDVADTEQLLRLIQSVPSPKAEPFKRWLAKVGYERLEEIENPELAAKRVRAIYEQKGYSEEWIEKRLRGIAVRDELTDEWSKRGVKEGKEFAILTAEISKATNTRPELAIINTGFSPNSFSATLNPRPIRKRSLCKPSKTAAFPSQIPCSPHWPWGKLSQSAIHPASSPSSSRRRSMARHAPADSQRVSSPSRMTSTRPIRKLKRCSPANPDRAPESTAPTCEAQGKAAFLILKDLLRSFNPRPPCEGRQMKFITMQLARKLSA